MITGVAAIHAYAVPAITQPWSAKILTETLTEHIISDCLKSNMESSRWICPADESRKYARQPFAGLAAPFEGSFAAIGDGAAIDPSIFVEREAINRPVPKNNEQCAKERKPYRGEDIMRKASSGRILLRSILLMTAASLGSSLSAQSVVQQAGANPVVINQNATTDVITYLTGGSSEHLDSTGVDSIGRPKYLWLGGFDQTNEYLKWNVSLNSAARYQLTAMIASGAANQTFNVLVDGQQAGSGTSTTNDWERLSLGTVSIPAGTHSITIKRAAAGPAAQVKTLELLRESDASALASRVAAFKTDTTKWNSYDYGIMFQYGPWGYPQHGSKKSIDQQAADFNVPNFVSMIKSTGAKYVLWSISWWTFSFDAPSSVVDNVVGNGDRTSSRDLIGDVAAALKKEGLGFYLYYHSGQDEHLGYNVTDWWIKQQWPDGFTNTGTGDRSLFFKNWTDVVTDLGQRYGSNLDGWFFDDGLIYYPGPFEALSTAARAGNSKRLVSFNSWLNPLYSDFQDVSFGEICKRNGAPVGGNGRYTTGSEKGVAGHCQEQFDGDWGIHNPDQGAADPVYTPTTLFNTISYRVRQKVPTSLNLLMWEDGTVAANSLAVLQGAKSLFDDAKGCAFGCARFNNDSPVISYTGGWSTSSNRAPGDYKGDVSATRNDGDSATISFTGSAVRLFAPKNDDYGDFEVILDGTSKGNFSAYNASGYVPRQIVYSTSGLSYGNHTLKIVKRSGNWMQIDHVDVDQSITRINDNDSAITKSGSWNYSANRVHADDYRRDVTYTNNNGDAFSYTFTGTGVQVMMPRDPGQGDVEFFLDGVSKGQVNTRAYGGQYYPEGVMFSVKDLPAGQHTVSAKKLNGSYMQLDAIETTGN